MIAVPAAAPPAFASSLAAWLARRRLGVRRLRLEGRLGGPASVLASLAGGQLAELTISRNRTLGQDPAALELHSSLTSLSRLEISACRLDRLPPAVAGALPRLLALSLQGNDFSSGESCFAALAACGGGGGPPPALTELCLSGCRLRKLPQAMSALQRLASLDIADNPSLGYWSRGNLHALGTLRALRRLDASGCNLTCVPPQLASAGPTLEALLLCGNTLLGTVGDAFLALTALTALTQLELRGCRLAALPEQLGAAGRLAALGVSDCPELGAAGEAAFALLHSARFSAALRSLDLRGCALERLPQALSALRALSTLRLDDNVALGEGDGEAAFCPLSSLTSLQLLTLSCCGLGAVPPQLAALAGSLSELDLSYCPQLGGEGGGAAVLAVLQGLHALRRLGLRGCGVNSRRCGRQLRALAERGVVVESD